MKLEPFVKDRLKSGLTMLGLALFLIALIILVKELHEAKALREAKAENDAKMYAGEKVPDYLRGGEAMFDFSFEPSGAAPQLKPEVP